ncbi:stage II sporulation protein M [Pseudonocardia acaciae]|uniref:stage II sporulation protein M n=1 Tax=Pseudonocardia acaciae TaxID=551276 RepID=UPI00048EF0F3|nr:stage II sporulation protein M [Pseudonocardia acaciae]
MEIDSYRAAHEPEWRRLERLVNRRSLSGAEADELVTLYQRVATHLSAIRSSSPDPALVGWLSSVVAKARSVVTGSAEPNWRDAARFLVVGFPAACYGARRWWVTIAVVALLVAWAVAAWVAGSPDVRAAIGAPDEIRRLVEHDFEAYYSSAPAGSFGTLVWTNNALVAATCLVLGVFGVPVVLVLWSNTVNLGVAAGLMAAAGRLDLFFGLITPHGLLELTAVFIAAGAGLRLGWTVVDPGPRPRGEALAAQGRATVGMALGLALVLLVSGAIEAFVTPSGLPTWARVGIGVLAEALFLAYVVVLGRRAVRGGETGDMAESSRGDSAPVTG